MIDLDDLNTIRKVDRNHMLGLVAQLPDQLASAYASGLSADVPAAYGEVDTVVISGMGGSAIGGDLLNSTLTGRARLPIIVTRDYTLPAWINERTLVIASSYSGNTEETLAAFEQAAQAGCKLIAVTTGGKLTARAGELDAPVVSFDFQGQPRAALGFSLGLLLGLAVRLKFGPDLTAEVEEAVGVARRWTPELREEVRLADNAAKGMAIQLYDRVPVVYGAGPLLGVARRWKGQFNENSEYFAVFEEMPEANHNAIVGTQFPPRFQELSTVIFLRAAVDHPRVALRYDITRDILRARRFTVEEVYARGESLLAQMLSLIHFGDYVTVYAALLTETDPTAIASIDLLKQRLAEVKS